MYDDAGQAADDDGALGLLLHRIGMADSRYVPTAGALPLLKTVCRQLDGLPLALEMAAARVALMGLQAVHDALAERFALLSRGRRDAPARHRSLRAALDWSFQLLDAEGQRLFRGLGVFAGGFTLDLAVALFSDQQLGRWHVVDGLADLVERSLVSVSGSDPPRYALLETMRAFAAEAIALQGGEGERSALRRRHAEAVLALRATTTWAWRPGSAHAPSASWRSRCGARKSPTGCCPCRRRWHSLRAAPCRRRCRPTGGRCWPSC